MSRNAAYCSCSRNLLVCLIIFIATFSLPTFAQSESNEELKPKNWSKDVELSANRLDVFLTKNPEPLKTVTAYKWSNTARQVSGDRLLLLYLDNGRPIASCKVYPTGRDIVHTFVSMTDQSIEARQGNRILWNPKPNRMEFQRIQGVDEPASSAALRRTQMKRIAREFSAITGEDEAKRQKATTQLRLLPTPLYRYPNSMPSERSVVDGAVFCFVVGGGNPQVLFLLEAVSDRNNTQYWRCGFSRRTFSELKVLRKSAVVWEVPHFDLRRDSRASFNRVALPPVPQA